jgi:putative membrane protein
VACLGLCLTGQHARAIYVERVVTDPRTLLANERTLLAWLRTGAALITLGFGVAKLGQWLRETGHHSGKSAIEIFGGVFVFLGAIAEFLALFHYRRIRAALLAGGDVPLAGRTITAMVLTVAILGVIVGVYVFL